MAQSADAAPLRLLFSADIGPDYKLMQAEPEGPTGVDYLICESTYGDVDRADATAIGRRKLLRDEVRAAINPNGVLLIPSFAVERAQELISDLGRLIAEGDLPDIPIYVDSPLATRATKVFAEHHRELEEGAVLLKGLRSRNLHFTETREQSMALDRTHGFHIVIAASGMCDAGRIRYRLKNWLWREEATVLFTGYPGRGNAGPHPAGRRAIGPDPGRGICSPGKDQVARPLFRACRWPGTARLDQVAPALAHDLFLVHGEPDAIDGLAARLEGVVGAPHILRPVLDESFELTERAHAGLCRNSAAPAPEQLARLDWHNDVSRLILDINDALAASADEKARAVLIRRLRRALYPDEPRQETANHQSPGQATRPRRARSRASRLLPGRDFR